jgi:nucleoside-diphosphate-sugar epimerase
VQRSALDPTLSREKLNFTAEVDLEDGLRRTLQSVIQEARAA